MFTGGTFNPRQLLRRLYGTAPFMQYCTDRGVRFEQRPGLAMEDDDFRRFEAVLGLLPDTEQARVELELAQVSDLAHPDALAQLLAAVEGCTLPPDSVPADAALSLWFLLHEPDLFKAVFLRHEISEAGAWRTAYAPPGLALTDLASRKAALADSLKEFFRLREGTGRFCIVDAHPLQASHCFIAYIADRLQLMDVFTDEGIHTMHATRPALPVLFAYYPADGRMLLKSRQRAADRVLDLFRRFGKAVLDVEIDERCLRPVFRLEVFKRRFDPPLNDEDLEMVRVKTVHLVSAQQHGRRRIKLETLSGDDQFAVLALLKTHGGGEGILDQLDVLYVELQVRLRVEGRSKSCLIRLWTDRCNLNQTSLGERLYACLRRWGIPYASQP